MLVQVLPGLPSFLHHPIWASVADHLTAIGGTISITPSSTWATLAEVAPVAMLSVVAFRLAADTRRAEVLLKVIVATVTGVAAYGLIAQYAGFRQVFLLETVEYEGFLTGTFVGRNAAATYFVIGLVVSATLAVTQIETNLQERIGRRPLLEVEALRRAGVYLLAGAILIAALLNTGSRGGLLAGLIGLLCVFFFAGRARPGQPRSSGLFLAIVLVCLLAAAFISGDALFARLRSGVGDEERLSLYRDILDMIIARPWLGHGGGTFADVYPLFHARTGSRLVWIRAHNSYLQAIAELGIPVAAMLFACAGAMLVFLASRIGKLTGARSAAIAAISAAIAAAAHSLVDFSIQFQAVGLTLGVLVGAGLGQASALARSATPSVPPKSTNLKRQSVSVPIPSGDRITVPNPVASRIPDGLRCYVFGDLHGRVDLLDRLKSAVALDLQQRPTQAAIVIGLGDYVDRGPQSKAVVEGLLNDSFGARAVFLRGNHEQMLLDFLEDPARHGQAWLRYGAAETLRSYGVEIGHQLSGAPSWYKSLRDQLARQIPVAHLLFLQRLPLKYQVGDYFFAHAGARPGTPLDLQQVDDLLWIRDGFIDDDTCFDKVIVHGHTPVNQPYLGINRINLDTGAYFTQRLSCLMLEGTDRRLLEV
jgi:serine/threonine protein phosphatase 1